ncbi:MAG: choice-of-anchor B family protein [Crocinitomicaceae bacterium]
MKYFFIFFFSVNLWSQDFFNVELLANWTNTDIVVGPGNVRFSDLWGFKHKGQKYAVVGSTEGSHFLKVDRSKISEVQFEPGRFAGLLVQHRDFKKYKNYIYGVCDEGNSSLQIFDISYLPDSVHKVYDSSEHFTICHNIFIDTNKAKLYACGPDNYGMKILDIVDPEQPKLLKNFTKVDYVHDCFVTNDTAFLNAGPDGLRVFDFSNNNVDFEIGVLTSYQEKGYNHSGWMDESRSYYCFIDETKGKRIKFCRIDNGIDNIKVNALFGTKDATDFIAHNISLYNGYAFVSYYNKGLRIFDLTNQPIKEVGFYDTYDTTSSYKLHGAWGVFVFQDEEIVLISDRQGGVYSFYFPMTLFRLQTEFHQAWGTPFIDESSKILINPENSEDLFFEIYNVLGEIVFKKQRMYNWLNIPLNLSPGQYIYRVSSENWEDAYSGKFIILH